MTQWQRQDRRAVPCGPIGHRIGLFVDSLVRARKLKCDGPTATSIKGNAARYTSVEPIVRALFHHTEHVNWSPGIN